MPKVVCSQTELEELATELVEAYLEYIGRPEFGAIGKHKIFECISKLRRFNLVPDYHEDEGPYVLRDGIHGSPILLVGYDISFKNLYFAKAVKEKLGKDKFRFDNVTIYQKIG